MRDWRKRVIRQLVIWLNPPAGKLKRMLYSDWLSEGTDSQSDSGYKRLLPRFVWVLSVYVLQSECLSSTIRFIFAGSILPARHFPRWSCVHKPSFPPFNKSFIDPAFSVTMARYWPRSFLCFQDLHFVKVHKTPAILTSRLYLIVIHVSVSHELIPAAQ